MNSDELRSGLLDELKVVEKRVRADLLAQYRADPALMARAMQRLREEENSPSDSVAWLETFAGRGAVLYILKTLYVRVLEDQGLLSPIRIRDGGTYALFRSLFPQLGHAAYLRRVFDDAERALPELFARTPVEIATPSGEAASLVWDVWQLAAPGGGPRFDFRGPDLDTRFIGDLYEHLDPQVKARYALWQTPRFVEEFILDRTLDPALDEYGLDGFRVIDPTCGSGHFLLGAFERLFAAWSGRLGTGAEGIWDAASSALAAVYGADLNEYACALSRFRLLLAVVRVTGVADAARLRALHYNVITCDSLIPWERLADEMLPGMTTSVGWLTRYGSAAERNRNELFFAQQFHVVVGNPPYPEVKDKRKKDDYRRAWPRSAKGRYSLSAPMTERLLLLPAAGGYSGMLVGSNFCKAEFGEGVIEKVLLDVTLTLVIDTSGASLPGHATPTIIMISRKTRPADLQEISVKMIASLRGGAAYLEKPEDGVVWRSITAHWSDSSYENEVIAVREIPQLSLVKHPWALNSTSAATLMGKLDAFPRLKSLDAEAGPAVIIIEDEAFFRRYSRALPLRRVVSGRDVRDWHIAVTDNFVVYPYSDENELLQPEVAARDLWTLRTSLYARKTFKGTFKENHRAWQSFERHRPDRLGLGKVRIVVGEITSNSQFVVDSGNAVFTRDAPVLTIPRFNRDQYLALAAVLNSSSLEFWFKSRCRIKNGWGENWEWQYVRNGANILQAPLPKAKWYGRLATLAGALVRTVESLASNEPQAILLGSDATSLGSSIGRAQAQTAILRERLVAQQEEIDWTLYGVFELISDVPLLEDMETAELARGHRPFEIVLGQRIEADKEQSAWFKRHGLKPVSEIPTRYSGALRDVLERRLALIQSDPTIEILEQPVYKRRWTFEPWETLVTRAAINWLLDALDEIVRDQPRLFTADDLREQLRSNPKAVAIASLAKEDSEIDAGDTIERLLAAESIPDNPARLLTPAGLVKLVGSETADLSELGTPPKVYPSDPDKLDWRHLWRLQEWEDAGHDVTAAAPPPFTKDDYAHANGWRIRDKFNIANERFIVYDELVPKRYAWGGWTTSQRAQLSAEVFDLRGRQLEADNSPPAAVQPTRDSPLRCGIQFPLWDKLDELRRLADPNYADVRELAMLCGRTCPCDVLKPWRKRTMPVRGKRPAAAKPAVRTTSTDETEAPKLDAALLDRLFEAIRRGGDAGITSALLEPTAGGDRDLLRRALDALRTDGRIEPLGRGRSTRYRPTENRLF